MFITSAMKVSVARRGQHFVVEFAERDLVDPDGGPGLGRPYVRLLLHVAELAGRTGYDHFDAIEAPLLGARIVDLAAGVAI